MPQQIHRLLTLVASDERDSDPEDTSQAQLAVETARLRQICGVEIPDRC